MLSRTIINAFCILFLLAIVVPAQAELMTFRIGSVQSVYGLVNQVGDPYVIVENQGRHHAHLWCASGTGRIGGEGGLWIRPGQALGWTFKKQRSTQFWCTMDWYGRRYGWDVYVANWGGNYGRWNIKNDGIYEGGGAKRMYIESNVPV